MSTPGKYDINFVQGSKFDITLNYKIDGTNVNLSNYTAALKVKEGPNEPVLVHFNSDLTANGFIYTTNAANGNLRLYMSTANSNYVPNKTMRYDLEITDANGEVERLLEGKFNVFPQYTK